KAAIAETVRAESGDVEAELSYQPQEGLCVSDIRLQIRRDGDLVLDQPITGEEACRVDEGMLKVQNLDDEDEPEVVLDVYSGGAHCCTSSMIYRYSPDLRRYTSIEHAWGNVGYQLQDLDEDGSIEFVSADDRFAYAFSSFAGSGFPPQIWQYRQGELVDVTRNYRQFVYSRAYQIWQTYTQARQQGYELKGQLAAYLATKYLLGEGTDGWQRVQQAYQESDRQQFFTDLGRFLRENGYTATATPPLPSPSPSPQPSPSPSPTPSEQVILREEGSLAPGDAVLPSDNSFYDRFTFAGQAGQTVTISLESTEFDTYLVLVNPDGTSLAQNDDISQSDRNSRISIELPTTGTYTVLANGYDSNSRGRYTLSVTSP
ncbi:MAG: hypothetical protein F6K28_47055, partial [Microcoleus sp. SIO2G3]|nr:hypothetical protein [Microcoleus sp. SIO2G3]